jgi:Cdc6-like AAA superfamily ATPase
MEKFNLYVEKVENDLKDKKFQEFLSKRKAGATKIEKQTRAKGGYSTLTAIHYAAKQKPYADAIKWENRDGKEKHFKEKAKEIYAKLKDLDNLTQREFQALMGELEVYGEVYIRSIKPNSIRL